MPAYDGNLFDPPAPLAKVTLRRPLSGTVVAEVPMLLDTGADVTLLPQSFVEQLGVSIDVRQGYELTGFDGSVSTAACVEAELVLLSRTFKGQFLVINQDWGIVGRDVLNHLPMLFDGPRLTWGEGSR